MSKSPNMSQTPSDPPAEEPTLESVAPDWVELTGKLCELIARQKEIEVKISNAKKSIDAMGLANFAQENIGPISAAAEAEGKPPRMVGPSKKVVGLLGKFAPAPVPATSPLSHEPQISREMRELGKESAALQEALELLHPQLAKARLEGDSFIRFQQVKIAAAHLCRYFETNMQQLTEATVISGTWGYAGGRT